MPASEVTTASGWLTVREYDVLLRKLRDALTPAKKWPLVGVRMVKIAVVEIKRDR